MPVTYFDCLCEIGPCHDKDPAAPWSATDALRWMDHCGIAGALVMHTLAKNNDPVNARARLKKDISIAPDRLFPVWSALPPGAGDFENSPGEFIGEMKAAGVHAVKFYPAAHNYPFHTDVIGPFFAALEKERTLALIDIDQLPTGASGIWSALSPVLAKYPDLPILLQKTNWSMQRVILALMDRFPSLYIEFSRYQVSRGIEEYTRRFGADRLLFGTGLTAMSAGAARTYIDYANVSRGNKVKIAGGNLSRLLGGLTPAPAPSRPSDPLRDRAMAREPLTDIHMLDAHCHILHENGEGAGGYLMYRGDGAGLVENMDGLGIKTAAIMSWAGPVAGDPLESNDIVARAVAGYPGRFLGVVYIAPTHLSESELMSEVKFRVEKQGFVALKPYHRTGLKYNDPLYLPCWDYANEKGLYALLHTGGKAGGMDVVAGLAQKYQNVQWVVAHSGGSYEMARRVVAVMKERANVWAELTLTPVTNGVIEMMVLEAGDDRILFGTDAPMRDPRQQFGWVVWSDLPVNSRRRILGENFQRLLNMRKTE